MRKLRDNQVDHESRISQFLANNKHSIIDDFFYAQATVANDWPDASFYDASGSSAQLLILTDTTGEHVMKMTTNASASHVGLAVKRDRCSLRFNQDMALFMEIRAKDPGATAMANIMFGLQDKGSRTDASDESDCIAFLKGTSAGKWRFRCASGGVASQTDDIGNRATWQKLRMELLRSGSGSTLQVRAYIDGAEISGSPFTTNIPTSVVMNPVIRALGPGAGTTDLQVDRWEIRWTAIPLVA
jgi:hypothetical protein